MYSKDICNVGEQYGHLVVFERNFEYEENAVARGRQRRPYYNCLCDCGNSKTICGYDLLRGNTTSCGCVKKTHKTRNRTDDLTGSVFGSLSVLHRDNSVKYGSGVHSKWVCKCALCGSTKSIRGSDLRSGNITDCGCASQNQMYDRLSIDLKGLVFGNLKVIEKDLSVGHKSGQHTRWICTCDICGCVESVSSDFLKSGQKIMCHKCCRKSVGEKKISEILNSCSIDFERDKAYLDCTNDKTGYHLRFDFIVNSDTGVYIIEYDGLQHFKSAPMWDENGDFEERKRRDKLKDKWCAENKIPLIRIPYTELKNLSIKDLRVETSRFLATR